MFEYLSRLFSQARDVFLALPNPRKVLVLFIAAASIAGFTVLLMWANKPSYEILYSGLSQDEAGEIVVKLKEKKIPYQLDSGGTTIMAPKERLQETRLELATEGLPRGGGVGMELFNKTSLSTSAFVQRLNYQRAIQGELERTIVKFPQVAQARIHLNIPKESLFLEDARDPSASVMLKLFPNRTLSQAQILGIVHLVSSSVEGLKAENISVVDTSGGLIYKKDDEAETAMLTASQIQQRKMIEKTLADRVTSMLERVVGPNKAVARVTAEVDYSRTSTTEETFNPDLAVVRSEERISEKSTGPTRIASGAPAARYNLEAGEGTGAVSAQMPETYEKTEETTNYDITRVNRQTVIPGGGIKRLSVAVMVDGKEVVTTEGDKTVRSVVPRTEEELDRLEEVVRHAIGYDEERGDTVVVTSFQFFVPEEVKIPAFERWWTTYLRQAVRPAINVMLIVLFFLFIVRPLIAWVRREARVTTPAEGEEQFVLPGVEAPAAPAELPSAEKALPDRAKELASQNPDRTLDVIRTWISE
ncbi:MAG: flagellar M-ring protein FliF [Deltaproteobacteria bacterium]|nr:flagellar M-ring protein FliF [Deltaproteobacteria bacterium]MBW2052665.1 flagellar M-ring protein FliF [Deltaproteobacteria bacterium]MBW2141352.1 flagellar M-ring protein FliF [Deltaproteobacteria bacterium]MBW2322741.1 flagellar M-ring protein FliF [Deltaproteobacteria bacterium]